MQRLLSIIAAIIALISITDRSKKQREQLKEDIGDILKMLIGTADKLIGWSFFIIVASPALATVVAFCTNTVGLKAFIALLPVIGLALYITGAMKHPSIIAAIKELPEGKFVLRSILVIGGLELAHGFVLAAIPFSNDPGLLLLATVGIVAITYLALSQFKWAKPVAKWIGFAIAIIIVIIILGGRDKLIRDIASTTKSAPTVNANRVVANVVDPTPIILGCATDPEWEVYSASRGGTFIVPVDGCPTPWVSYRLTKGWQKPDHWIEFRTRDVKGKVSDWEWDSPWSLKRNFRSTIVLQRQYRNTGKKNGQQPVTVTIG
jgi:hypothetical protein